MGEILDAGALAPYSDGAVVSRTLLKNSSGSATVFSFDKGEGLSEHTAPFDALVHVLDGEAEITVGGVAHLVGAGRMIVMPGGTPHALRAVERFKMILYLARLDSGRKNFAE